MSEQNGSGEVVARSVDRTPLSRRDPIALAQHFANSGFFKDASDMSKAVVKIVAGEELGIGPMASMTGIHIIDGKPSLSANLLAVQVKRSNRYDYRVLEEDDAHVKLVWTADGEEIGTSEFTVEQAKKANLLGKNNWKHYLADMLFSRALTRGVRRFCPEVTAGAPAYTPEELGAEVDEAGEPLYVESRVEPVAAPETPTLPAERVEQLLKGWEIVKPIFEADERNVNALDGLNVMLGSLGIDGFKPSMAGGRGGVSNGLAGLTPEQADLVEAEFNKTVDAEQVALAIVSKVDQEEGGEADADA